jgi:hypothetical protein
LFGSPAETPKTNVALTPLEPRAYVVGTGGSNQTTQTNTTGGNPFTQGTYPQSQPTSPYSFTNSCGLDYQDYGGYDNSLSYFIEYSNWVFNYSTEVTSVGLLYFGNPQFYTHAYVLPSNYQVPTSYPVTTSSCTKYQVTLTSPTGLARLRLDWDGQGQQPTFTRSPDETQIQAVFYVTNGDQSGFTYAVLGNPGAQQDLRIQVSTGDCTSGATTSSSQGDLTQFLGSGYNGYSMAYWSLGVGNSLVEGRFVNRPYYEGCQQGYYCNNGYSYGFGYSPLWQQQ